MSLIIECYRYHNTRSTHVWILVEIEMEITKIEMNLIF